MSSPARRAPASAASSARSSAPNISISAAPSCRRRSARKATNSPNGRSKRSSSAFNCATVEDLYVAVGEGLATGREVVNAAFPQPPEDKNKVVPLNRARRRGKRDDTAVPIRGLIPGMALHFAGCCHPLPGDRIVGIVTTGKGVTIHTIDCDTLESFADEPERWLDVAWSSDETEVGHVGRINVTIANEPGNLGSLTTMIGKQGGNISNLKITNRSTDFFEIMIDIEVADVKHLSTIIAALRATPVINSVERARGDDEPMP